MTYPSRYGWKRRWQQAEKRDRTWAAALRARERPSQSVIAAPRLRSGRSRTEFARVVAARALRRCQSRCVLPVRVREHERVARQSGAGEPLSRDLRTSVLSRERVGGAPPTG